MASGVHRLATVLREHNHALVQGFHDLFGQAEGCDPGFWHSEQACLWILLTDTEARIRRLKLRRKKRNRLWKVSRFARSSSPQLRHAHQEAIKLQMLQLEQRVSLIRQIGDVFAWAVARNDPRFVTPFFKDVTHQLPDDHSVDGLLSVLQCAAQSDAYLVVLSDLTRCCGTGDVLILGDRWPCPSPFEVKVKRQQDGELYVFLYGSSIAFKIYPDELEKFTATFDFEMPGKISFDERGEVQKQQVDSRTRSSEQSFMELASVASPSIKRHWAIMGNLIEKAMRGVIAFDTAEHGIAYVAVPADQLKGDSPRVELQNILAKRGIAVPHDVWEVYTSWEFIRNDRLSACASPFLTWKLPSHHVSALMTGEVLLGFAVHRFAWQSAFRRVGVTLKEHEGAWLMTGAGREIRFDPADVRRLKDAVAYTGASPAHTATIAASELYMPGFISVDRYGRSARVCLTESQSQSMMEARRTPAR